MFKKRDSPAFSRKERQLPRWRDDKKDYLPGEYGKKRGIFQRCFGRRWSTTSVVMCLLLLVPIGFLVRGNTDKVFELKERMGQVYGSKSEVEDVPKEEERTFQVLGKDGKMRTIKISGDDDSWTKKDVEEEKIVVPRPDIPKDEEVDLSSLRKSTDRKDEDDQPSQKPLVHKKKPSDGETTVPKKFVSSSRKVRVPQTSTLEDIKHGDVNCKDNCDPQGLTYARNMLKHAWDMYMKYAKGHDDLRPISKSPRDWYGGHAPLLSTPIDAMDTLWIANLKDEFNEAKELVEKVNFDVEVSVSFFETTIRQLGGLLAAYDLSKEQMFLDKAVDLGRRLSKAFDDSAGGLAMGLVTLRGGHAGPHGWLGGISLAETGTIQLEFEYLAHASGEQMFLDKSERVNAELQRLRKSLPIKGLWGMRIDVRPTVAMGGTSDYSIGGGVDSFYEYLLKLWIWRGRPQEDYYLRDTFDESMKAVIENLGRKEKMPSGRTFTYIPGGPPKATSSRMEHLGCFIGGSLAFGAKTWEPSDDMSTSQIEEMKKLQDTMWEWGAGVTETCKNSYTDSPTGIGAETADYSKDPIRGSEHGGGDRMYILRPETIESIFYMWRLTKDEKYRDWAWELMQSIEETCRTDSGYAGIQNVNVEKKDIQHIDLQESFFLAETLKYLYLIFSDDDVIPLDKYVFNTEAHVLGVLKNSKLKKKKKKKPVKEDSGDGEKSDKSEKKDDKESSE